MSKRVFESTDTIGLHTIVSPEMGCCKAITILRLNLAPKQEFYLETKELEMNGLLIKGNAFLEMFSFDMKENDSFYLPGRCIAKIIAGTEGASFYIGAAKCEGIGKPFIRKFDSSLPFGTIHQIHGEGAGAREVFFTLEDSIPASRLICGFTIGGDGTWTSWPPHQHEKHLEEAYCYYHMPMSQLGYQLYYPTGGMIEKAEFQAVHEGSVALAADGYHPTVAVPGTCNRYFWVMAAFTPADRSYDHAKADPRIKGGK